MLEQMFDAFAMWNLKRKATVVETAKPIFVVDSEGECSIVHYVDATV